MTHTQKLLLCLLFLCSTNQIISQTNVTAGTVRTDATFENISVLYNVSGDTNLNSNLEISYRRTGSGMAFQPAAMTMRTYPGLVIDGTITNRNFHAGSVMYLTPNTNYDIRLRLTDPNGGGTTSNLQVSTKAIPQPSVSATIKYVVPGSGGGTGSSANPFQGIDAAIATAQAGDHFILRPGEYTPFSFTTNGTASQPIVFESQTPHTAIINGNGIQSAIISLGQATVPIQHIIIDGFIITDGAIGIDAQSTQFVTVRNCLISNVDFGYYNRRENNLERDQYITNNYFVGRTVWPQTSIPGERGVDLRGNNNVASYNYISYFADGVSTDGPAYESSYSLDIHHNDIFNTVDDFIEVDGTVANSRVYRNRGFNGRAGVSVAPVYGGPMYILRNEFFNLVNSAFKMNRGPSGLVVAHNTVSCFENTMESSAGWQNTFFRNNVMFAGRYCFEEYEFISNAQSNDWDYGAYKSTRGGGTNTEEFKWNNIRYATVPDLQASGVLEANCVQVEFSDFINIALPASETTSYEPSERDFRPVAGSPVINSADPMDNVNDPFVSDGQPDRGALEFGMPLPVYGPDYVLPMIPTENSLTFESVRIDATFEHIGINVSIDGDDNLNSTMQLSYRAQGSNSYLPAAKSMRAHPGLSIDGATWGYNFHAASALFLNPGTTYDLRIVLTDSDGGSQTITRTATTKSFPQPSLARIRYVAPGNGGGTGTSSNPFLGLQAAADSAQPGDHFIVRPGNYAPFAIEMNGTPTNPISFLSETQHGATINGAGTPDGVIVLGRFDELPTAHIIIDGFKIQNGRYGIDAQHAQFVTVRNNIMTGVDYGYINRREDGLETDQYITNNLILGNTAWPQSSTPNERGVDIRGNNNVVSFNTIENFGDGVSTEGDPYRTSYSLDIHNNEIKNIVDDHIEVDGMVSNSRVYKNRGFNARAGISLAPVFGGPAYIFRNEIFNIDNSAFKMNRSPSGLIIAHNTVSSFENAMGSPAGWQNTCLRNNVLFAGRYCFEEYALISGSIIDDWDYGAYKSTRGGMTNTEEFKWENIRYATVPDLQASGALEANCVQVEFSDFVNIALPASKTTSYSSSERDFYPTASSPVINSADPMDNLNLSSVTDGAPDRGALEFGAPRPFYGHDFTVPSAEPLVFQSVRIDATFEHIGVNVSISGDDNLNSTMQLSYKVQGTNSYFPAAKPMRAHPGLVIDGSSWGYNFHAASALFLQPGTTYDLRIVLTDIDGGTQTINRTATTKSYPEPSFSRIRYVAPGNGGGTGTSSNPYLGLQAAADSAQPGDHFIVRPGVYGSFSIGNNGTAANPISFLSETQHAADIDGNGASGGIIIIGRFDEDPTSHIIIDGFDIRDGQFGIDAQHTQFVTVRNNRFTSVDYGYINRRESSLERDQYITNNEMIGNTAWPQAGIPDERGIDIRGNNNVVSFNTIENFGDGVSTDGPNYRTSYSLDIHNNDIKNMVDDHIEIDGIVSNARVYRNRGYNARAGVSLAPVFGGPAYVIRNEFFNLENSAFKMNRGPSGLVIAHNTVSNLGDAMSSPAGWQNTCFRNNVMFSGNYCFQEYGLVDGSVDDWDYGSYQSTRGGGTGTEWFKWDNIRYATVPVLQASGILESNSIAVGFSDFNNIALPASTTAQYSPSQRDFSLTASSAALNNGDVMDNINRTYVIDGAPDRGALEYGRRLPRYGANFNSTCFDAIKNGDELYIDCGGSCPPCDDCPYPIAYVLEQPIQPVLDLKTNDWILSNGTVGSSGNVSFQAGNHINLISGFEVSVGAVFLADIDVCN